VRWWARLLWAGAWRYHTTGGTGAGSCRWGALRATHSCQQEGSHCSLIFEDATQRKWGMDGRRVLLRMEWGCQARSRNTCSSIKPPGSLGWVFQCLQVAGGILRP